MFAHRAGDEWFGVALTRQANALFAAGDLENASILFVDAETRQRNAQPQFPWLFSLRGYQYCDLLLSRGLANQARDRAIQTLQWTRRENIVLDVALETRTLGRAYFALALQSENGTFASSLTAEACAAVAPTLDDAVERLRAAGQNAYIALGLIARAAFRRAVGHWEGAARDLNEAHEIAEPGPMRLYLCDCALERARLALARREAFAPLTGLVETSPPPPVLPEPAAAASLKEEARNQLDVARKLIAECGYHRRDEELTELDVVVVGDRRFVDLPPRVWTRVRSSEGVAALRKLFA